MNHPQNDKIRAALWSVFIADALAMPTHWIYDGSQTRYYGTISDYVAPLDFHPTSMMQQSSTGGPGRGTRDGDVIGSVILHGKKRFWYLPNLHYHQGMFAGQNTLNILIVRVLIRTTNASRGNYDPDKFLASYIDFMTTPNSHNDTYAESYHRAFFAKYVAGVHPRECGGNETIYTATIGGLVSLIPIILLSASKGEETLKKVIQTHLYLTHRSLSLLKYAHAFGALLMNILNGEDIRVAIQKACREIGIDLEALIRRNLPHDQVIHGIFSNCCSIQGSFPTTMYIAYQYAYDYEGALLFNANLGGENCHRGACLGAILGLAHGMKSLPVRFVEGLYDRHEIAHEIDAFTRYLGHRKLAFSR